MGKDLTSEEENMPIAALKALEAVLLFHSASPWDEAKRKAWQECCDLALPNMTGVLPGPKEVTTKVLCDMVRAALGREQ